MKPLILFLLPTLFLPFLFSDSKAASPAIVETDDSITVRYLDGRPIFSYRTKPSRDAERHEPHFSRTGYLHPLYSPSGKIITGDYAPDHPHQHGLFFAWTKSSFRNQPTEFWNQKKKLGDIRFHRFLQKQDYPSFLSLQFEQIFTNGKDSDEAILKENWEVRVPKKQATYFQFDLISTQTCATQDRLRIEKYQYGGMAIRGNKHWVKTGADGKPLGKMITSEGKNQENGNHTRPRWVTLYGPVDGQDCGVVVMNHPDNFRFPQWVRLHPKMPYFVYAPMVEKPFTIEPDRPYVSKFRYLTYDGTPDHQVIEGSWKEWIKN